MKLKTDTWHYEHWQLWLKHSTSARAYKFQKRFFTAMDEEQLKNRGTNFLDQFIVEVEEHEGHKTYRLYEPPMQQANLCIYFWTAILRGPYWRVNRWFSRHEGIAFATGITALILATGTVWNIGDPDITWWVPYAWVTAALAAMAALVVGALFSSYMWQEHVIPAWRRRKNRLANQPSPEKGPNIVVEHLKAKKSKVCPILEFEE